jgi:hypothetical protein
VHSFPTSVLNALCPFRRRQLTVWVNFVFELSQLRFPCCRCRSRTVGLVFPSGVGGQLSAQLALGAG